MSDTLTFAKLDAQHGELLPARTVLTCYCCPSPGGRGGTGGGGGNGFGGIGVNALNVNLLGSQTNIAGSSFGGASGSANGG